MLQAKDNEIIIKPLIDNIMITSIEHRPDNSIQYLNSEEGELIDLKMQGMKNLSNAMLESPKKG